MQGEPSGSHATVSHEHSTGVTARNKRKSGGRILRERHTTYVGDDSRGRLERDVA